MNDELENQNEDIVEVEEYRLLDLLDGGRGIALGKVADREGLDSNLDAIFRNKLYLDIDINATEDMIPADGIVGDLLFELSVDSGANAGTNAIAGGDRELFNAIRLNGWFNDTIEE